MEDENADTRSVDRVNVIQLRQRWKSPWAPEVVNQQDTHWAYASQPFVQLWMEDNKQEHIWNSRNKSERFV